MKYFSNSCHDRTACRVGFAGLGAGPRNSSNFARYDGSKLISDPYLRRSATRTSGWSLNLYDTLLTMKDGAATDNLTQSHEVSTYGSDTDADACATTSSSPMEPRPPAPTWLCWIGRAIEI